MKKIKWTKTNDGQNITITGDNGKRAVSLVCANISDRKGWLDTTMKKNIKKELSLY